MIRSGVLLAFALADAVMCALCGYAGMHVTAFLFGCAAVAFAVMAGERGQTRQGS